MKLTREQVEKWNAKNGNGFKLDIETAVIRNEKEIRKYIKISDNKLLEAHICYRREMETKTNEYGCKWNVETGRQLPTLHLSVWTTREGSEMMSSTGVGDWITVGEPESKKNFSRLQKISCEMTDEKILEYYNNLHSEKIEKIA